MEAGGISAAATAAVAAFACPQAAPPCTRLPYGPSQAPAQRACTYLSPATAADVTSPDTAAPTTGAERTLALITAIAGTTAAITAAATTSPTIPAAITAVTIPDT